jgi:hypothetical protein
LNNHPEGGLAWIGGPPDFNLPEIGTPKNKLQIPVTFFTPENVTAKSPHLPRNPPQIHHQNTTFCHRFSAKPPAKTRKPTSPKNRPYPRKKTVVRGDGATLRMNGTRGK